MPPDYIEISGHPSNQKLMQNIGQNFDDRNSLIVLDLSNSRRKKIMLSEIEVIQTMGHLSKVSTFTSQQFQLNQKLKELDYLTQYGFFRISRSTILNLACIKEFNVEPHARLQVKTLNNNKYLVSRYYAKAIKEKLIDQRI